MFFLIDNDLLQVESKHDDYAVLEEYVESNGLGMALTLVSTADDLEMAYTLHELNKLFTNLDGRDMQFEEEDGAASAIITSLGKNADDFPKYTAALGKKMLKKGEQDNREVAAKPKKAKPAKATSAAKKPSEGATRSRIKLDYSDEVAIIEPKCKQGSILHTIVTAVEDEMCTTVGEVVEYITGNHVIPKTGELADVKFAEHNIKYFAKQGKINLEEGL